MADKKFPKSDLPIRKTVELLPSVFQTDTNDKFMSAVVDPLVQPGVLEKLVGYIGRRYGKTYTGSDVYLDTDATLRSRYQLEPGVVYRDHTKINGFYDYLDLKNQLKFFGNTEERDDLFTSQEHYSWNPPIDWDKFINYREYFWEPSGPPAVPVEGQKGTIVSTYKVKLGDQSSFIFTPDGYTNNPSITLYRGQTYKFTIDAPNEGFIIRTNYDTGSLIYNPNRPYTKGEYAIYDGKLWKANVDIVQGDGSTIDINTQDWQFVELISTGTALDYNKGVTNNGIQKGTLTFKVPNDAPDLLFYQGLVDPNRFGRFVINDIESNTKINIEKEIIGKTTYTSSNGIEFTNGLVVEFRGNVSPTKYATDTWLVEGVGTAISLTKFSDLVVPVLSKDTPEIVFDNEGFDTQPFDDATAYPGTKDYITIARDSQDRNPWSRYNRWFHRSVLEYAYKARGEDFPAPENFRAKRPVIEFKPNIQLHNHGAVAKEVVDYVDDFTTDVFSSIEGSTGYNIDGEPLFQGARVLVIADKDNNLANNRIYEVNFIVHNNRRQITLRKTDDTESIIGQGVLVRRGNKNAGLMFHFDGTSWVKSQQKTSVNQAPLFDVFDDNGVSFSNAETYPVSSFTGCKLVSYKVGNTGTVDKELGFKLSYLNIDNVGDIQFNWDWDIDSFEYSIDRVKYRKNISTGFYKINPDSVYGNGWIKTAATYIQPIIDSVIVTTATNSVTLTTLDWNLVTSETPLEINFYLNGKRIADSYTRSRGTFTFARTFAVNDVVSVKIITDLEPNTGYYAIPVSLEKNPLNDSLTSFTLGQAIDHISSALEFSEIHSGEVPGVSNLRDIDDYQPYANRFLKHSGIAPISFSLLCDKKDNIIKSIQYAKKSYTDFKNNFLAKAIELPYNTDVVNFVDDILSSLTKTKTAQSPFADSDMIGNGAYTSISYEVEDTGIKTYSLSQSFNLETLSRRAVYVYLNGKQLLYGKDYTFNSTFGFVNILKELQEGNLLEIREYVSTAFSHIPPTPTSMGLYKKYTPMKFLDDTYVEPRNVIQGHDGSITFAYDDFRDDLLLELEYRIYNNIKTQYDEKVFDIDKIIGGYYGNGLYSKSQLDNIVSQEFLKWIQNTNINYTLNTYFDSENSFTYTYSNMTDPLGTTNLPGWWRGVYQWFYDTDRPHRCPWEMLGFSEMPTWWEGQYGAAPYTSGNLLLWEDLRDGIIRQGDRAGTHDRYKRPTLLSHLPVDGDGKLLSPLDSGLAGNFTLVNNRGSFSLGDVAPAEYAWRASSEWPFAVVLALCLMKPFEFITDSFDRSKTKINKLGQTVNIDTDVFAKITDLAIPKDETELAAGLVKYLVSYVKSKGRSLTDLETKLKSIDVNLSTRLSGFVDKAQQKYLLDSKSPKSSSSSVYIPAENYDIIFNVGAPIASVTYSGVIVEKTNNGWTLRGYDDIHPYFNYFKPIVNQKDPLMQVGGVSETFVDWITNKTFDNGQICRYQNLFYRALKTHNSGTTFDATQWRKLAALPLVNSVEALRRKNFNTFRIEKFSYGSELTTIQEVVDILLGYEAYLQSVGFKFDRYDTETATTQNWTTSCKEFMFWTRQNWSEGAVITLSPSAEHIDVTVSIGVADNILDGFYDYQILKADGKPLTPNYINVNRSFQNVTVETTNTTEGIYYLKLYYVLKENVTVFSDRTVFNDIIYDKATGYRQERIKTQGFRTVDWDGDYTSPGFLFDNVNIDAWMPWTDYKLGDIVSYRSYNWTSLVNQLGTEEFDDTYWSKLDSTPEKQLVSNFDYKINQFEDYYDAASEGVGQAQRELARHAIGYQTRDYLQNLAEDPVTQFQLYQGFIREKGTSNSINKVFNKLSRHGDGSVDLREEWAFRVGRLGGVDQLSEVEISIYKKNLEINPQPLLLTSDNPQYPVDQYYRLNKSDFTVAPVPFTFDINPVSLDAEPIRTAGYLQAENVEHTVTTRDGILDLDIDTFKENDHVWITFDEYKWSVVRFNLSPVLAITNVVKTGTTVVISLNRRHSLLVDDIIGIKDLPNLTGFYKITAVDAYSITVKVPTSNPDVEFTDSSVVNLYLFTEARFPTYENIDTSEAALLRNNSKLFVDNNGSGRWEVVQKKKQFVDSAIDEYGITSPSYTGSAVLYINNLKQVVSAMPGSGYVMSYTEIGTGLNLDQIIEPPDWFKTHVVGSFGQALAVSPDSKFLVIGSPDASAISSNYRGEYSPTTKYLLDDIVLYDGKLWRATKDLLAGDGSTINIYSDDWTPATLIPAVEAGRNPGYTGQGVISVYVWEDQNWKHSISMVSPRPANAERFGAQVSIGFSDSTYYMSVSAPAALDGRGRVYLYKYDGTEWSHIENNRYKGVYNPSEAAIYYAGDIVWQGSQDPVTEGVPGNLWVCLGDSTLGDGSTLSLESVDWKKLDSVTTQCSLPTNVSIDDDGSTLALGLLTETQISELIKQGDEFGTSMAMSSDASILVVGSPNSDGQYFANYRGMWRPDVEYIEGSVVKYNGIYYKLGQRVGELDGSTTRSFNELPDLGGAWDAVGDSSSDPSGKVYVYGKNSYGVYELLQTLTAATISGFSDLESGFTINTGDQFGFAVDIDHSGKTLVVTSPKADINFQNQGSAYVFKFESGEFRLKQKLESFELYPNEYFGQSVSVGPTAEKIVIGAKNSPYIVQTRFDITSGTTFDQGKTRFADSQGYAGAVYVFDLKGDTYFLTEKLDVDFSPYESFGYSVDCVASKIVVGSPDYREPVEVTDSAGHSRIVYPGSKIGITRLFTKDESSSSWDILGQQKPTVDISQIKSIALYDNVNNIKLQDLDYVDHAKLKILNSAEKEIRFKTIYDPAIYSTGTDEQSVDTSQAWAEKFVGHLWWNLSTAKWLHYEQDDVAYRVGNWNSLAPGASIDVYEWVETPLLPSEWAAVADTNEGIAEGISGQPLHPNDDVYSIKEIYSAATGLATGTLYYYWVRNKTTIPTNMPGRKLSAASVASYISNPAGTGIAFIALIDSDKLLAYNFDGIIAEDTALINIQYHKKDKELNPIHNEYQLLTEGVADSLPAERLEAKWIDSLAGQDIAGNRVPDSALPAKQKYGLSFRPRQSMFINRITALRSVVENINSVLKLEPFADLINFDNLNLVDAAPSEVLNQYDTAVDVYEDLIAVGTTRVRMAVLNVNLVNGEVDTIDIVDKGFGYKPKELVNSLVPGVYVGPPVTIQGNGTGATAKTTIDRQGQITSVTVTARGRKYSIAQASVRRFSVLVNSDSTLNNQWSIYAWDDERKTFYRSRSQSYNTPRYWTLVDWWKSGYGVTSRIVKELVLVSEEQSITEEIDIGDLIRIKEYAGGGWAVFERISALSANFSDNYRMVGREKGTIEISSVLYKTSVTGIGYDNTQAFDTVLYDIENSQELRNILKAVKEDIFLGDYAVEWNKLFFSSVRYAFSEQQYIDWAFKTSFLNAIHSVGSLEQKINYKNDNLVNFQDYIEEVKPYRTTVREYVSCYDSIDRVGSAVSDFDLPSTYSTLEGKVIPIKATSVELQQYPWKWWADNNGYSVISIEVYDTGADYTSAPRVLITGNGTGATAQAFISNGKVSGVRVLTPGTGYTSAPTITLVGGNPAGSAQAKAVAIIGDSKARTFDITIKFDRLSKDGFYKNFTQSETFVATGYSAVFELNYAPTRDKSKITILKNNQLVLNDEYSISLYKSSTDGYGLLKGKIIFAKVPQGEDIAAGLTADVITVLYEKNDELLDSVNRIQKYYDPSSGMKGTDLGQLMTGIDFGGVQIQGTTFDVTGGWDALPWFTDSWDSVESSADYYHVCDGSTTTVKLPFVPADGQEINIYIKRAGARVVGSIETQGPDTAPVVVTVGSVEDQPTIRVDDPFYNDQVDSSTSINPNAQMPTFIGDGINDVVEIGSYLSTNDGDILIFRPVESDGSVVIKDPNLLDTLLSGGTLANMSGAYSTATGKTAEEITIDGDKFISPDQVPAPEENIPGQVLDSVSIKVFNSTAEGVAPLQSKVYIGNGTSDIYDIDLNILETKSVIVYIDKIKQIDGTDYTVNLADETIRFGTSPANGSVIEIIAVGLGGVALLDYQEFIADGVTKLFLTAANYVDTTNVFVTVNGVQIDVGFIESTGVVDTPGKTLIQFVTAPLYNDVVKIVSLSAASDVDSQNLSLVRVNKQVLEFEGSTRSFILDNFVSLQRADAANSMVVEVNNKVLRGADTIYFEYDGNTNEFVLGTDPEEPSGTIVSSNIKVYINNELKTVVQDYVYDGITKLLTIEKSILTVGDVIKIENDLKSEYDINGDELIIRPDVSLESFNETDNDIITVTWFSEYPSMQVTSDEFTGGKVNYKLNQVPLNINYVWAYKTDAAGNTVRLTKDKDFYISLPRSVLYLTFDTTDSDLIKIITFGAVLYKLPSAYEIHKDMLNIFQFKRYSVDSVKLTQQLNYYDQSITVNDASLLADPIKSRNIPGIVLINGERIEYMNKSGNVLSQLRRGSFGTAIAETHAVGSTVVDVGPQETIPYNESQDRTDFITDGSTLLVGPLNFVPSRRTDASGNIVDFTYKGSIPTGYYPCDEIEVFVGGRRLRKDPTEIFDEEYYGINGKDKQVEAEFSVDGTDTYIRLTSMKLPNGNDIPAGTRITVIKRTGRTWYDRGDTAATSGKTLLENSTAIAKFIAQKTTNIPE